MNAIVNPDEVRKAVVDSLSNPSEDIARHVLAMAGTNPSQIEKAITTGTGLVAYDLQAPARNLIRSNRCASSRPSAPPMSNLARPQDRRHAAPFVRVGKAPGSGRGLSRCLGPAIEIGSPEGLRSR